MMKFSVFWSYFWEHIGEVRMLRSLSSYFAFHFGNRLYRVDHNGARSHSSTGDRTNLPTAFVVLNDPICTLDRSNSRDLSRYYRSRLETKVTRCKGDLGTVGLVRPLLLQSLALGNWFADHNEWPNRTQQFVAFFYFWTCRYDITG